MSTKNLTDQEIAERVKALSGASNDSQMAEILGITPQSYHNQKKRGTLWKSMLKWGIQEGTDLNWLIWGGNQPKADMPVPTAESIAEPNPAYRNVEMKLGRALEIVTKIMQDGPKDLRRALTAELHYLDKHLDALGEPVARTQTLEDRLSALENALSSATRRAESAEARLRKSGTM